MDAEISDVRMFLEVMKVLLVLFIVAFLALFILGCACTIQKVWRTDPERENNPTEDPEKKEEPFEIPSYGKEIYPPAKFNSEGVLKEEWKWN